MRSCIIATGCVLGLSACSSQGAGPPSMHIDGGVLEGAAPAPDGGTPVNGVDAASDASASADASSPSDAGTSAGDGASPSAGRKRGLAYGSNSNADMTALSAGIGWWYNWSPSPDGTLSGGVANLGVEFVPMIWGGTFDVNKLATQIPAGTKYLLTFNEPNFGSQSNLTPAQAAALWPQIQTFAQSRGMKIVSPALNYCGSPCNDTNPFDWLSKFFAACTNCEVDYVAMHWYACDKTSLVSTATKYEQMFKKELWITEFSCLDTASDVTDAFELSYMQQAVAALEADPMVFRYAWFTGRSTASPPISLLADAGVLTPLGSQYVSLPR